MLTRKVFAIFISLLLLSGTSVAQNIAMLTSGDGVTTENGTKLNRLKYVSKNQKARVEAGSKATFSYVSGGSRYTITGPCTVTFLDSGPEKTGTSGTIESYIPPKRKGKELPSELNLEFGGHVRRGELKLHLPRFTLPGEQVVEFTGTPTFTKFYVTVFDSEGRKYESEELTESRWLVPAGGFQPGETYEFLLEGRTDSGRPEFVEDRKVTVLDEVDSKAVQEAMTDLESDESIAAKMELLAIFLEMQLDAHALELMNQVSDIVESDEFLYESKKGLEETLEYVTKD